MRHPRSLLNAKRLQNSPLHKFSIDDFRGYARFLSDEEFDKDIVDASAAIKSVQEVLDKKSRGNDEKEVSDFWRSSLSDSKAILQASLEEKALRAQTASAFAVPISMSEEDAQSWWDAQGRKSHQVWRRALPKQVLIRQIEADADTLKCLQDLLEGAQSHHDFIKNSGEHEQELVDRAQESVTYYQRLIRERQQVISDSMKEMMFQEANVLPVQEEALSSPADDEPTTHRASA